MRWLLALLAACDGATATPDALQTEDRVLVYTRANAFVHGSEIATMSFVLPPRLAALGIQADITDDPEAFTDDNLARYRGVFFIYTSGNDVLPESGKAALESFVRAGGGWLGVHSAADTEYSWPFYGDLVGAYFKTHPATQPAQMIVEEPGHPIMDGIPSPWRFVDEWYDYRSNPRAAPGMTILATVDESTYIGGSSGADHPIIWCHERLGGRAFYSGIGHVADAWEDASFVRMIDSASKWVIRRD